MLAIDNISSELANRGWSIGDLAFFEGAVPMWQVFAHCGEQRVLTRARTKMKRGAWPRSRFSAFGERLSWNG